MQSELIIVTKDRAEDLECCFESIKRQVALPQRIIIVDSSGTNKTERLVQRFSQILPLYYLKSEPGLTRQRNIGIRYLLPETEVVHFIDDDVILHERYFYSIEDIFGNDITDSIGGVGGFFTNKPIHKPTLWQRFFILDSKKEGVVLPSWKNILVFDQSHIVQVDWLSGCSMSYRKKIFNNFQFDINLKGYSLGEDVDFSYRVSRMSKVVITPQATMIHNVSPVNRLSKVDWARSEVVHRYYFVKKNLNKRKNYFLYWWSVVGFILINSTKSVTRLRRGPLEHALGAVLGVKDVLLKKHYLLKLE